MNSALAKLLSVSSGSLLPAWNEHEEGRLSALQVAHSALLHMLRSRNGFFAFESALHVYPLGSSPTVLNLLEWNSPNTWRHEYGALIEESVLFFAQDVFGNQFAITKKGVVLFYSEFAECEQIATDLDEWADALIANWREFTGFELAHEWQLQNRPLSEGERLIPKIPFVIGGKYEVENLYAGRIVDAMRFRGSLARQLAAVPDGTPISVTILKH